MSSEKINELALKLLKMVKTTFRISRALCYLDQECKRIDETTFVTGGLEFKVSKELQQFAIDAIDRSFKEIREIAKRYGVSDVPISFIVMRVWSMLGYAFSPCTIYVLIKEYCEKHGIEIVFRKHFGEEFVLLK